MVRRMWLPAAALAALLILVAACTQAPSSTGAAVMGTFPRNGDGYADITVEQLAGMLENKDFSLINVHIPYEGEIPQTDLFLPFDPLSYTAAAAR